MDILIKNSEIQQLAARILNGIATDADLAGEIGRAHV